MSSINFGIVPAVGLGTFQIKDAAKMMATLDSAFCSGYRLIDTASVYKNEVHIGKCISHLLQKYSLDRKDIFVTTKLGPNDLASKTVMDAVNASLDKLKLDFIDLYLIHWPGKQGIKADSAMNKSYRKDVWQALEKVYKNSSKIRYIGVSNYTVNHLSEMLDYATILPTVLQSEFHIDYQNDSVIGFCHKHKIHYQSYSSLGASKLVNDERLMQFAQKYKKSIPQILLRWCLQMGCSVIPKSQNPAHIAANIDIFDFEISNSDMDLISKSGKNTKYCWNPEPIV